MLHYGLDVHKKYTNICVMDGAGTIVDEGRTATDQLACHPAFSLEGKKRVFVQPAPGADLSLGLPDLKAVFP